MAYKTARGIWTDILTNAGVDKGAIIAAMDVKASFFTDCDARNWTEARACVDAAETDGDLTSEQAIFVKSKVPAAV